MNNKFRNHKPNFLTSFTRKELEAVVHDPLDIGEKLKKAGVGVSLLFDLRQIWSNR